MAWLGIERKVSKKITFTNTDYKIAKKPLKLRLNYLYLSKIKLLWKPNDKIKLSEICLI